jgi:2-polyprenyl-3-methyl-5-hydroxy-6-metoxy-1,4-benzoquinol methylase
MKNKMRNIIRFIARALSFLARKMEMLSESHETLVKQSIIEHDMYADIDEVYYAKQYLDKILPVLKESFPEKNIKILDLGCAQGRLSIPMAKWNRNGNVYSVDFTEEAINKLKIYMQENSVDNIDYSVDDIHNFCSKTDSQSFDVVVMTEVIFVLKNQEQIIKEIERILKPGGILFISFRTLFFNLLLSLKNKDWDSVNLLLNKREGTWGNGKTWFTWHTRNDIRLLLSKNNNFNIIDMSAIGVCSGIEGDPFSVFAQPGKLSQTEQQKLEYVETFLSESHCESGRYILVTAKKEVKK